MILLVLIPIIIIAFGWNFFSSGTDNDFSEIETPKKKTLNSKIVGDYIYFSSETEIPTQLEKYIVEPPTKVEFQLDEHQQVAFEVSAIQKDIFKLITKFKDNLIVSDIESLIGNYAHQICVLLEKDKKLEKTYQSSSIAEITSQIAELNEKLELPLSEVLKEEYQNSIEKYQNYLHSFEMLKEKRIVLRLRINSALMSMKQVKIDLVNMENIPTLNERESFLKDFEEKSKDLSNYLNTLESSYKDIM